MNQQTEAMKLALEALGLYARTLAPTETQKKGVEAITALQQALAQPQQEPVEYWTVANGWVSDQAEVPAAVWVEPDFWEHCNRVNCGTAYRLPAPGRQPLYTSPPAQQEFVCSTGLCHYRKPLTDEEIKNIAAQTLFPIDFARAIEAAHGIKENT